LFTLASKRKKWLEMTTKMTATFPPSVAVSVVFFELWSSQVAVVLTLLIRSNDLAVFICANSNCVQHFGLFLFLSQGCNERALNWARSFALIKKHERERERAPFDEKERERQRSLENLALKFYAHFLTLRHLLGGDSDDSDDDGPAPKQRKKDYFKSLRSRTTNQKVVDEVDLYLEEDLA